MAVINDQQAEREAQRAQANREELGERIAQAAPRTSPEPRLRAARADFECR